MGGLFKAGGLHSKLVDPLKIIPEGTFMDQLPGHKRTADKKVVTPSVAPKANKNLALRVKTSGPVTGPATVGKDPALGT